MIKKLWNGDVRLVITYWVYFVLISFVYGMIVKALEGSFVDLATTLSGRMVIYFIVVFHFIYFPFIFVAVWRSANKYKKSKGLASVAKIIVIINVIVFLLVSAEIIKQIFFDKPSVNQVIQITLTSINKRSPRMIDNDTELLNASFTNNIFSYNYKLIDKDISTFDSQTFISQMQQKLLKLVCTSDTFKFFSDNGVSTSFNYADKQGTPITQILIKPGDCSVSNIARITLSSINEHLPQMIDSETELLNAGFTNNIFSYNYKLISKEASAFDSATFITQMQKKLLKSVCAANEFKYFLSNDVSISFNYTDKQGIFITKILIMPSDCRV